MKNPKGKVRLAVMSRPEMQSPYPRRLLGLLGATVCIFVLSFAGGCSSTITPPPLVSKANAPMQAATGIPSTPLSGTATPDMHPTPTDRVPNLEQALQTREAYGTWAAQNEADLETEVAQSTRPPHTPGPVYARSPLPTATWESGFVYCGPPERRQDPEFITCWRGTINGQLVGLGAGHEQAGRDGIPEFGNGNPEQGLLEVDVHDLDQELTSSDVYTTPQLVGPVTIVAVSGTLVTLVSTTHTPPVVFGFDLAARQWVSPPPTMPPVTPIITPLPWPTSPPSPSPRPSPSAMPTSGPSPSAEPSPLPSPSP